MMPTQNLCASFIYEVGLAIHDFVNDQFNLALYVPGASLDPAVVAAYSAVDEVAGAGYSAGGFVLTKATGFPQLSARKQLLISFQDVLAVTSGYTTRKGLLYNASKANRAIAVTDWGLDYPIVANLLIKWPPPTDENCMIRLGAGYG